jgi:hypothetical protein
VLTSAAALSVLAVSGNGTGTGTNTAGHERTVTASATPNRGPVAPGSAAATGDGRGVAAAGTAAGSKPKTVTTVRTVVLRLPTTATKVGANVTGMIEIDDVVGTSSTPIPGAAVALQQKRGLAFVTVADGVTDETGQFAVAFTNRVNCTWRAQLTSDAGAKKYSPLVSTIAAATVTWASRPDMDVVHGVASSYSFRVSPVGVVKAHLEIANSKTPNKWIPLVSVVVPGTGLVVQSEQFPTAGTWFLRGATSATTTNGSGYTTALTVVVS